MILPAEWQHLAFFQKKWPAIRSRLEGSSFLPGPDTIFRALEMTPPHAVRVIILGQDPYPTPGHADGLAFSVTPETPLPRSLSNIFREMNEDIGAAPQNGNLGHWAQQGVLLLNSSLSVPPGQAGAHARWGWDRLACEAVAEAQKYRPMAFILWGNYAQKALSGLPRTEDLLIETPHPSPLSARRGFFGSRPFSRVNNWLTQRGDPVINWTRRN
ncbi:MAG: uracil-DNA glycosylase [Paracoccus sp. (in: a-proteobacteria)]